MPQHGSVARLDVAALAAALERRQQQSGMSLREIAAKLDLAPSTLTRLRKGGRPDAEATIVLMAWLELSPLDVLSGEPVVLPAAGSAPPRGPRVRREPRSSGRAASH